MDTLSILTLEMAKKGVTISVRDQDDLITKTIDKIVPQFVRRSAVNYNAANINNADDTTSIERFYAGAKIKD